MLARWPRDVKVDTPRKLPHRNIDPGADWCRRCKRSALAETNNPLGCTCVPC